jgi:hypothetical protein
MSTIFKEAAIPRARASAITNKLVEEDLNKVCDGPARVVARTYREPKRRFFSVDPWTRDGSSEARVQYDLHPSHTEPP